MPPLEEVGVRAGKGIAEAAVRGGDIDPKSMGCAPPVTVGKDTDDIDGAITTPDVDRARLPRPSGVGSSGVR